MLVIDSRQIKAEARAVITGLPKGAFVEYFGTLHSGQRFIILRPEKDWDYNSFSLLVESEGLITGFATVKIKAIRN